MQVDIKEGGDGVACWNAEAITAYAAAVDAREAALASANPDLDVTPGRVKCYGCQVNDFGLGLRCTAELTRTLYAVAGEIAPRAAEASGSLADIPGLRSRVEETEVAPLAPVITSGAPATGRRDESGSPVPPAAPERRGGLSRLLGRRG